MQVSGVIIFFVSGISLYLLIVISASAFQLYRSKFILSHFEDQNFQKLAVRFNQSAVGIGSIVSGFTVKAILYLSDDFIIITPKKNGFFNFVFNKNLPIVLNNKNAALENRGVNFYRPDKLSLSSWGAINIKYKTYSHKYSIQLKALKKEDHLKLNIISKWCS